MVGGGNRKDGGSMVINNTNVFAALETLRKKKRSDKERSKESSKKAQESAEPQVYWAPAPLSGKAWADVDDDDDDDYFATTAPPQSVWRTSELEKSKEKLINVEESESESEDDFLNEGDEYVEEDHENEALIHPEPLVMKAAETSVVPKETERQLSKKERKKKELEELEALLADFGVSQKQTDCQVEPQDAVEEKKEVNPNGDGGKEVIPAESKAAKKKKKKPSSKEAKETQSQPNDPDLTNSQDEPVSTSKTEEEASTVDMKERLKKMASMKKKKSSKEMDAAAKAAALEAAARSAKLQAVKKKEKNHYNQQPVR